MATCSPASAVGQSTTYEYGPDGARVTKLSNGETTIWLGADYEIQPDGTIVKHVHADARFTTAPGGQPKLSILHRDHLASVKLITDETGAKAVRRNYRPFGPSRRLQANACRAVDGEGLEETFSTTTPQESKGFIGERFDPETGLQYLNARYYDPALGRFIQPDWWEVTEEGVGTNRYAYCGSNPINCSDPGGNTPFDLFGPSAPDTSIGSGFGTGNGGHFVGSPLYYPSSWGLGDVDTGEYAFNNLAHSESFLISEYGFGTPRWGGWGSGESFTKPEIFDFAMGMSATVRADELRTLSVFHGEDIGN